MNVDDVTRRWQPPKGMTIDPLAEDGNCVVLGMPGKGFVTIDMRRRFFGLGVGAPRQWGSGPPPTFSGRGWEGRLLQAASEFLESV